METDSLSPSNRPTSQNTKMVLDVLVPLLLIILRFTSGHGQRGAHAR